MVTFDHVHIFCTDLEAMIAFWTKGLGAEFVKYRQFGGADGAVVNLAGAPIFIKLIPADSPAPVGAARGLNHLGIRVEDPDAFAEKLGLPKGMTPNALLAAVRVLCSYEEYCQLVGRT